MQEPHKSFHLRNSDISQFLVWDLSVVLLYSYQALLEKVNYNKMADRFHKNWLYTTNMTWENNTADCCISMSLFINIFIVGLESKATVKCCGNFLF